MKFEYKNSLIKDTELATEAERIQAYINHMGAVAKDGGYDAPEASINLPFDEKLRNDVQKLVKEKCSGKLKYFVVIGIGGSNLGTLAAHEAVRERIDEAAQTKYPQLLFADTLNPLFTKLIGELVEKNTHDPAEVLINVISKSGSTTETIVNFEVLYARWEKKFGKALRERIVVTTDEGSKLWRNTEGKGMARLAIPKLVGGRYSVFSAVGLLPLAAAGIDIEKLHTGARTMREVCLLRDPAENPALASAIILYLSNKKSLNIHNTFLFHSELEPIGKWYRQLMGESIGKEHDAEGNIVHAGITPIISVGSTDLHSMAQLYFGGPKDKITTFVYASEYGRGIAVSEKAFLPGLVSDIEGKDLTDIMQAIYGGVCATYEKNKLPFMEILLPDISEASIAGLMQLKMIEMMYLAKLLGLNAFDQPNVEAYKEETRKLLAS